MRMDKKYLIIGKKYLHQRTIKRNGCERKVQRWENCKEISLHGATFEYENEIHFLNNDEIQKEIIDMA